MIRTVSKNDTFDFIFLSNSPPIGSTLTSPTNGNTLTSTDFASLQTETQSISISYKDSNGKLAKPISVNISPPQTLLEVLAKINSAVQKLLALADRINQMLTSELQSRGEAERPIDWHALVLQEEAYRRSDEIMKQYALFETDHSLQDWITYTSEVIQPYILTKNGIEPNAMNLHKLRIAAGNSDVFWVKYNRARKGHLRPGDPVPPQVVLFDVEKQRHVSVSEQCVASPRPSVLLAGSIS